MAQLNPKQHKPAWVSYDTSAAVKPEPAITTVTSDNPHSLQNFIQKDEEKSISKVCQTDSIGFRSGHNPAEGEVEDCSKLFIGLSISSVEFDEKRTERWNIVRY